MEEMVFEQLDDILLLILLKYPSQKVEQEYKINTYLIKTLFLEVIE